ncbi:MULTISPECIES: hypothetical protein [unclassified Rudaea]|uniref:hypothetical protein n=1 Tax=unclassified Rudaea TaxID=2627037 RepID=UPI002016A66B|nr:MULTISPECIES: hypothetical protein [unclassified Rudaea]
MNGEVLMVELAHERAKRVGNLRASHRCAPLASRFRAMPFRPKLSELEPRFGSNLHFDSSAATIAEDHVVDHRGADPARFGDVRLPNAAQFQGGLDHYGIHVM